MANDPSIITDAPLFVCHSARDGGAWTSPVAVHIRETGVREQPIDLIFAAGGGRAVGRILAVASPTFAQIGMLEEAFQRALRRRCRACSASGDLGIPAAAITKGHTCGIPDTWR